MSTLAAIYGRPLLSFAAVSALCLPRTLWAQFTDPRTYTLAPVGINQLEVDYAHAQGNAAIDTSLATGGANFELNQATVAYTHNFGAFDHLAWVKASVPFARLSGSVVGTSVSGSTSGGHYLRFELGILLNGGRALSAAELAKYQPATTWGASLTVSAPTGEYNPDKLLNLGSHRWSFKPEFGIAHLFGRERTWEVDAYVNAYFFTDNSAYRGVQILRQEPLPGLEAHLSHDFSPGVWASLDARYSFRGDTVVDGIDQHSSQQNLTAGAGQVSGVEPLPNQGDRSEENQATRGSPYRAGIRGSAPLLPPKSLSPALLASMILLTFY